MPRRRFETANTMRVLDRILPWRRKRIEAVTEALDPPKKYQRVIWHADLIQPGVEKWFEESFDGHWQEVDNPKITHE